MFGFVYSRLLSIYSYNFVVARLISSQMSFIGDNVNNSKRPAIGFVGLGLMGSAMVERLQEQKHEVYVLANNSRKNIENAIKRGAVEVSNGYDLACKSDVLMICVNTSETVEKLIYGSNGIKEGA